MSPIYLTGSPLFVRIVGDWLHIKGTRLVQDPVTVGYWEEDGTRFTKAHYSHGPAVTVTVMPERDDINIELPLDRHGEPEWPLDWPTIADRIIAINDNRGA